MCPFFHRADLSYLGNVDGDHLIKKAFHDCSLSLMALSNLFRDGKRTLG